MDLINQFPKEINWNGTPTGFALRYSASQGVWVAGYGAVKRLRTNKRLNRKEQKTFAVGDTPEGALHALIDLQK